MNVCLQEEAASKQEYDTILQDVNERFSGMHDPQERRAAMRNEVWEPTQAALQVCCSEPLCLKGTISRPCV